MFLDHQAGAALGEGAPRIDSPSAWRLSARSPLTKGLRLAVVATSAGMVDLVSRTALDPSAAARVGFAPEIGARAGEFAQAADEQWSFLDRPYGDHDFGGTTGGPLTVAWISYALAQTGYVVDVQVGDDRKWALGYSTTSGYDPIFFNDRGGGIYCDIDASIPVTNAWHYGVLTHDGSQDMDNLAAWVGWMNGLPLHSFARTFFSAWTVSNAIGCRGGVGPWNGYIAAVLVANRTWTAEDGARFYDPATRWDWLEPVPAPTFWTAGAAFVDLASTAIAVSSADAEIARERDVGASASGAVAVDPNATRVRDVEADASALWTTDGDFSVAGFQDFATWIPVELTVDASLAGTINLGASASAAVSASALLGRDFALAAPASFALAVAAPNVAPTAVDDGPFPVGVDTPFDGDVSVNDVPGETGGLGIFEQVGFGPFFGFVVFDADGSFTYLPNPGITNESDAFQYRIRDANANVSPAALVSLEIGGYVDLAASSAAALSVVAVPGFLRGFSSSLNAIGTAAAELIVSGEQLPFHALASIEVCPLVEAEADVGPRVEQHTSSSPAVAGAIEVNKP